MTLPNSTTRRAVFLAFDRWKERGSIEALSESEQTLVLVWSLLGIAIGEGLGDFYDTTTAPYREENVAALNRIGAFTAAQVLRHANAIFAKWDQEHENSEMNPPKVRSNDAESPDGPVDDEELLDALEQQLSATESDVWALLEKYVSSQG